MKSFQIEFVSKLCLTLLAQGLYSDLSNFVGGRLARPSDVSKVEISQIFLDIMTSINNYLPVNLLLSIMLAHQCIVQEIVNGPFSTPGKAMKSRIDDKSRSS